MFCSFSYHLINNFAAVKSMKLLEKEFERPDQRDGRWLVRNIKHRVKYNLNIRVVRLGGTDWK